MGVGGGGLDGNVWDAGLVGVEVGVVLSGRHGWFLCW